MLWRAELQLSKSVCIHALTEFVALTPAPKKSNLPLALFDREPDMLVDSHVAIRYLCFHLPLPHWSLTYPEVVSSNHKLSIIQQGTIKCANFCQPPPAVHLTVSPQQSQKCCKMVLARRNAGRSV